MENLSIHPRNWKGMDGVKKDTSKPQKGKAKKLDRKLKRRNARRNDYEATIKAIGPSRANAFRAPGSMNDHK